MAIPRWKFGIKEEPEPEPTPEPVRRTPRWKRGIKKDTGTPDVPKGTVVSKASDKPPIKETALEYLIGHADPKQSAKLEQMSNVPYFTPVWQKTPWKTLHQTAFQIAAEQAHRTLKHEEKEEYGFRYTDWESIPLGERKHHYGASQYFASLSPEEKKEMGKEYYEQETKDGLGAFDITEFGTRQAGKGLSTLYSGQDVWKEEKHQYMYEKLSTPSGKLKDIYFSRMPSPVRWWTSASHAAASWAFFPVTLTQTGVKYATGEGDLTDVLGRIRTGKPLFFPDVGKSFVRHRPGSPLDLPSVGISEGIGAYTGEGSDEWERFMKDPISGAFATGGAVVGYLFGSTALHGVKTGASNIWTKFHLPKYPMAYRPTMLIRKGYWKAKERLGLAQEVSPESVFQTSALPGGLSYAPGSTPSARISATIKAFEQTKIGSHFVGVHTTVKSWLKPFAWLRKGRETPGVSFAPLSKGSPRFLRISGDTPLSYDLSGVSLFPQFKLPTSPLLFFKKLHRHFVKESGRVSIAPKMYSGGGEYEVIARGIASRTGVRYFTQIDKVVVPLPEFMLREGAASLSQQIAASTKSFFSLSSSSAVSSTVPLISPTYFISFLSRLKSSTPSVSSYTMSSYEMSYPSSSKLSSKISSTPSSLTSYKISSKPSSIISSTNILSSIKSSTSPSSSISSSKPSYKSSYDYDPYDPTPVIYPGSGISKKKKKHKPIDWTKGYRERTHKVFTTKELVGGI